MASRMPAVADLFYPGDPAELAGLVRAYLDRADNPPAGLRPKALIVPHAGYVYSGPVAATAYRTLAPLRDLVERVILMGPAHQVYLEGLAVPEADVFTVPTGEVPVDVEAVARALRLPGVVASDGAHAAEHSLEVHLPFLQAVLDRFSIVPIVVGARASELVAEVLDALWGGEETLIVVSSDLSHYHSYEEARAIDVATSEEIVARASDLTGEQACGAIAINGLMRAACGHELQVRELDVRNSGDTAGGRDQVVGYGAFALG
ncbi:MAG: AmmeMemoRadiSam system protein B [Pseudomonadales bacterium]|nr:AmmeMemoRadiSam system protein B [Pseudomonadales bacterium]NIX09416.1 AmmeMemoRadiSam system protein B [Pseudomonadales bacterium]